MKEIVKYDRCFVCGDRNEHGLQARFFYDGERAVSELVALESFEGYRGIYHGGIISAMLDEVMIKAILAQSIFAVTAELTVRYHRPVETGTHLQFIGWVTEKRGRVYYTSGQLLSEDGVQYAAATGKYIEAGPELQARLKTSLNPD